MVQCTHHRFYTMLTARFWGITTGVLCALLLQNCQSQLNALEEESPAEAPLQSGCQPPASEALTQSFGYPPSLPPTTAIHQPKVPPKDFSETSPFTGIRSTASTARSRNSLTQDSCRPLTASTGELVHFQQVDSQWQAVVQGQDRSYTPQRTLSVVSSCDIGTQLSWLQSQDSRTSRAHIHVLNTSQPSYSPCVYLGRAGLWGGMPSDEEEDSKLPARRKSPSPDDELAQCHKKARHGERQERVCRDTVNILLEMAGSEPDKASDFLEVLLAAVKDRNCRQQALRALGRVAQASPDRVSECLPSLRAAARHEDREVRLTVLKILGEAEWKHYFGDVGSAPDLPSDMVTILDGPCPFWPDKLVKDTHLLVLMPATVGGVPFTLNGLGELIKRPSHGGHRTECRYYNKRIKAQVGAESPPRSYWVLMTRDVLPGSQSKGYAHQKAIVAGYAKRKSVPYVLPSVLEAATAILMHHVRAGERLFGNHPWTYTRCQEGVNGFPVVVGGEAGGLFISIRRDVSYYSHGVSCLRKF
jgi:hypothetical protein